METTTHTSSNNRRGWMIFAAALTATALTVWGANAWENERQAQQQDDQIDQLVDDLCAQTTDC